MGKSDPGQYLALQSLDPMPSGLLAGVAHEIRGHRSGSEPRLGICQQCNLSHAPLIS